MSTVVELDITPLLCARRVCSSVAWAGWLLGSALILPAIKSGSLLLVLCALAVFLASYWLARGRRLGAVAHSLVVDVALGWVAHDYLSSWFGWTLLALAGLITAFGVGGAFKYHRLVPEVPPALKPAHRRANVRAFFGSKRGLKPIGLLVSGLAFSLPTTGPIVAFLCGIDVIDLLERWRPPLWGAVAYVVLVPPCITAAYRSFTRAKHLMGVRISEIRALDPRRPILLLRSFRDDLTPLPTRLPFTTWQPSDLYPLAWTLEETIARFLGRYGPVIAIGRPGEAAPPSGAAREYVPNEAWRDRIKDYIAQSALLVVILGKTEGLAFEYRALAEMKRLSSAVLVCPPGDAANRRDRWSTCRGLSSDGSSGVTPEITENALAGTIVAGGGLRYVVCRWRDAESYRMALEHLAMPVLASGLSTAADGL